jgi:hypothetical protein
MFFFSLSSESDFSSGRGTTGEFRFFLYNLKYISLYDVTDYYNASFSDFNFLFISVYRLS